MQLISYYYCLASWSIRKGTNGVSTNGVTAGFVMFFDRGAFWAALFTYFCLPKVPRRTSFLNLSTFITFAAAPVALSPFVRNQTSDCGEAARERGTLPVKKQHIYIYIIHNSVHT